MTFNIIVRNIPHCWDEKTVRRIFSIAGGISNVCITYGIPHNEEVLPFCYISYDDESAAKKAVDSFDGVSEFDEIKLCIPIDADLDDDLAYVGAKYRVPNGVNLDVFGGSSDKSSHRVEYAIVISNIPPVTSDDVKSMCKKYGTICSVNFKKEDTGITVFVRYKNLASVFMASCALNGRSFKGHCLKVEPTRDCQALLNRPRKELKRFLRKFHDMEKARLAYQNQVSEEEREILWTACKQWKKSAELIGGLDLRQLLQGLENVDEQVIEAPLLLL